MTVLGVLTRLNRAPSQAVSNVGHDDEYKEKRERQVGFIRLDYAVDEHDVQPYVGNDGPDGRDCEHTSVLHLLDTPRSSRSNHFFIGALIVGLVD